MIVAGRVPLNGVKTHPLSPHALAPLQRLERGPTPSQEHNPGVINRLLREDLIELVQLPSPYKKGGMVGHARITPAGRAVLDRP